MLRRVATHPPSLPTHRISFGLFGAAVDEHQKGLCRADHEECDDGDTGNRLPPGSWRVVDHDGRPHGAQHETRQANQLDVVPQFGVVEPIDEAQEAEHNGIPCIFDEPFDSVHGVPFFSVHLG